MTFTIFLIPLRAGRNIEPEKERPFLIVLLEARSMWLQMAMITLYDL